MDGVFEKHLVAYDPHLGQFVCACGKQWAADKADASYEHMMNEIRKGMVELTLEENCQRAWRGMARKSVSGKLTLNRLHAMLWARALK